MASYSKSCSLQILFTILCALNMYADSLLKGLKGVTGVPDVVGVTNVAEEYLSQQWQQL